MNYIMTVYMLFTADWVAYSGCISILEQHFVFTEVSSCLLSHLYWLLLAHQCFFNFSISVESPFPLCICLLILVASYSLSLMVFLPSVLLIHWALLCPEFHLLSFFPYSLTLLQLTSSHLSRLSMRQNCGMLVYLKLCPHLDWEVWRALEF